jgi:hypothetical protein
MSWEAIGAIGEVVGAVAVLITLIYLAQQIRQNTRSMDESRRLAITQAQQDWTAMFNQAMIAVAESPHSPLMLEHIEDLSSLDEDARVRLRYRVTAMAARLDMMYLQYQNGFLPQETYDTTFVNSVRAFGPLMLALNASLDMRRASFVAELRRIVGDDG